MSPTSPATSRRAVARVTLPLYGSAFLEDLVLLYPVYAVLFAEHGLSTTEISTLFVLWSLTGVVLELPSGVLADRLSRKLLVVAAPLLAAAGFALWTFRPGFAAFAVGFVLWGAGGAMRSGAREALVYEELDRVGAADRYADVMGRALALATVAVAAATGIAAPVLAIWGYSGVGVASIAACVLSAVVAAALPEHRTGVHPEAGAAAVAKAQVLWDALGRVRRTPALRYAVLAVPAAVALWGALEEYLGLLAVEQGVPLPAVPVVVLVVSGGAAVGGLLGGRLGRLGGRALPGALAAGGVALVAGGLLAGWAGTVLMALAFGAFQAGQVVVDAQLQHRIDGGGRATITSLAGLLTDVAIIGIYAAYGIAALAAGHAALFAASGVLYLGVAAALLAGRPRGAPLPDQGRDLDSDGVRQVC
ncbi:MAG TPA: MFS transporter [Nocardioides sp.]|nr:MFS transporter [Nocardioides sp.]